MAKKKIFYSTFFLILFLISCSNKKKSNRVVEYIGANALSIIQKEKNQLGAQFDKVYSVDKTFTEPYKKFMLVDSLTKEVITKIESYSLVDGTSKVLVESVKNYLNSVQTITNSKDEERLNGGPPFIDIIDLDTCLNFSDSKIQLPIVLHLLKLQILQYQIMKSGELLYPAHHPIGIQNNWIVNLDLDSCSVLEGNDLAGEVYLAGYNSKSNPIIRTGEVNTELFTKKNQLTFNSVDDLPELFTDGKYEELSIKNGKGIINKKAEKKGVNFLEGVIINVNLNGVLVTYFSKDFIVN
tara:strand:- start:322 stop:1209 length:888 start_codon:yes stop_codon:yes gene_type:complete